MNSESTGSTGEDSLTGKRLLLVLGSYKSKRHIYEHAREMGVRLVVVDGPGHWMRGESGPAGLVERHLAVDLAPFATFVERATAAARESGLAFDGIGTIDEFAGGFAARIAHALGLPFHTVAAADLARDKHRAREACLEAGLPSPRFARIEGPADLDRASEHVGFPAVLKPVSGVGSVQAFKVTSREDLAARFARVLAEVGDGRSKGARGLSSDRDWFDLMWSGVPTFVLESWIEGPKYDVDLLLEAGEVVYAHSTDDLEPCGLRDIRRVAPASLDEAADRELISHAAASVRALGFRRGPFNVEVKRTAQGPRTIEVNGRLGGYSTTDIHRAVWGVDLVEQWLRSSLNLPLDPRETSASVFAAESLLPSPRTGILECDGFLESVGQGSDVIAARPWVFAGDAVAGVETAAPDWLGSVVVSGSTRDLALAALDERLNGLHLPVVSRREKA